MRGFVTTPLARFFSPLPRPADCPEVTFDNSRSLRHAFAGVGTFRLGGTDGASLRRIRGETDFEAALLSGLRRARRLGVVPSRWILTVNIARQSVGLFERILGQRTPGRYTSAAFRLAKRMRCSTSKFGIGEKAGSNRTPRGLHRIARKIGGGWPVGTAFKAPQPIGYVWNGLPDALITTRILWLDGLETGFNRGGDVDSFSRYIYIHGTGYEPGIGRPASHGCVQIGGDDLIPLYKKVPVGTLVWISER